MPYVSEEQYRNLRNLRDMIDGELNRIAVTDDVNEINHLIPYLQKNIEKYAKHHRDRINGVYNPEKVNSVQIDLS